MDDDSQFDLRNNAHRELTKLLGIDVALDGLLMVTSKRRRIDIIKLDDAMVAKHRREYDWDHESLSQFLTRMYGTRAVELIRILL